MKMINKKMNKRGIATIYIIIFVVILLAFVGFMFWNNYKKSEKSILNAAGVTINPEPTKSVDVKITSTTYPNPTLTPGNLLTMDVDFLCIPRTIETFTINTSEAVKKDIFKKYKIKYPPRKEYQIDRYVPIKLGGSNDIRNLWPQSITYPGYKEKNEVEDYLYNLMCNKTMDIVTAQNKIKTDWVEVFKECCLK